MVENPIANQQDIRPSLANYIVVQDYLKQPLKQVIHLVGFPETHSLVKKIYNENIGDINKKDNRPAPTFIGFNFDTSVDQLSNQNFSYSKLVKTTHLGYLRQSFFQGLALTKPGLALLIFDWKDQPVTEWRTLEAQILNEIKVYRNRHSLQTKLILLIFLPLNDPHPVEEKISSLKHATQRSEHAEILKMFFLITTGLEGLKNIGKKFSKIINDQAQNSYRDGKAKQKKKLKKVTREQKECVRFTFQKGNYSEILKGPDKAIKAIKEAYFLLKISLQNISEPAPFEEKRENADIIVTKLMHLYLITGNTKEFNETFREHFYVYQQQISQVKPEFLHEEYKWRANFMRLAGELIEDSKVFGSGQGWTLIGTPYYYFQNASQLTQSRIKVFKKHNLNEEGQLKYDTELLQNTVSKLNNFIGKEQVIMDKSDPLGASSGKTSSDYLLQLSQYKTWKEHSYPLNVLFYFLSMKARTGMLKDNLPSKRMPQFLTYQMSQIYDIDGQIKQSQEAHNSVYKSLVKEGWSQEAVKFIEKSKETSTLLGEHSSFFMSELEILNYDEKQPAEKKQERFVSLIRRYLNSELGNLTQTVYVHSQDILKATVSFDLNKIQVNHYNQVHISIESFLQSDFELEIKNLKFKFNMDNLDFEKSGPYTLKQGQKIDIDEEIFISFDDFAEFIILQLVTFELVSKSGEEKLTIGLLPRAKDNSKQTLFHVESMPNKIKFDVQADDQALIGENYEVIIEISPDDTIDLKTLCLNFDNIDFEEIKGAPIVQDISLSQSIVEQSTQNSIVSSQINSDVRGVTVTRHKTNQNNADPFSASQSPLANHKDFEVYFSFDDDDYNLQELDFKAGESKVDIANDCRRLRLVFVFYQEATNLISISFNYSFYLKYVGKEMEGAEGKLLRQIVNRDLKVQSECPFALSMSTTHKDPYIMNLALKQPDLLSSMSVPLGEDCLFQCTLSSKANRELSIYSIECDVSETSTLKVTDIHIQQAEGNTLADLSKGETYQQVFFLKGLREAKDLDQFADIVVSWSRKRTSGYPLHCLCRIPTGPISIMELPFKVSIPGYQIKSFQVRHQDELINMDYQIENKSEEVLSFTADIEGNDYFIVSGESKSQIQIMPFQRQTLSYQLLPLGVGRVLMPRLFVYHAESVTSASGQVVSTRTAYVTGFGKKILIIK